jgi:hypothetical protein
MRSLHRSVDWAEPGVKTTADVRLVSIHRGFSQAASGIAGALLPAEAFVLRDGREMLMAPRYRSLACYSARLSNPTHSEGN